MSIAQARKIDEHSRQISQLLDAYKVLSEALTDAVVRIEALEQKVTERETLRLRKN